VTADTLVLEELEELRAMHTEITARDLPYAQHLEGSYIPQAALRRYDPQHDHHPTIGADWDLQIRVHGSRWIFERQIVREHGVVVYGPPPSTLIDPVSSGQIRWAVCHALRGFWSDQIKGPEPEWLRPRDYQAFAILTMCRALSTLKHGVLLSKPQAAAWARQEYPQWQPIIDRALLWRSQHEPNEMEEMLVFLREALALALQDCPQDDSEIRD
jgi:hypothetical protein